MTHSPPVRPAPPSTEPPQQQSIKVLSILWYIYAGLNLLGICGGFIYIAIGVAAFNNPQQFAESDPNAPPPEFFAWLFTGIGVFLLIITLLAALLSYMVARRLSDRRGRTFCVVVASIACINIPFGTALGVFTLVTILRDDVKATFT